MSRLKGAEKVSGRLVFTEDLALAGLAHVKLVLSYVPSGCITAIDAMAAREVPGVVDVLTGRDLEAAEDRPDAPIARERVFYVGQPVAAVIAETPQAAADGAAAVSVEYEEAPAVTTPRDALDGSAPVVLPETGDEDSEASLHGATSAEVQDGPKPAGNVTAHVVLERGDAAAAWSSAGARVEGRFLVARVHHAFLEPHVVTAAQERDGSITVWSPTQGASVARADVARSLGVEDERVRVVPMPVGGGFGGKIVQLEPLLAHVARAVGRPVRLQLTRSEEFLLGWPAPASEIGLQLAAEDGDLVALKAQVEYDNGAAGGWHAGITAELMASTYRVPNFQIRGREVATNKLPATSYRAPGAPQAYFALESCIDELARRLEMDPVELRLRNASREGDPRGDGSPWPAIGLAACLERARTHPAYTETRKPGEGIGVAVGCWIGGFGPAATACRVDPDGTLALHLGTVDISGSDTGFIELAAQVFGTSPDRVRVLHTDTASAPPAPMAAGSATTYSVGPAVIQAVLDVRRQILEAASPLLEAAAEDLEVVDGSVRVKGAGFRSVTVAEVAEHAARAGGPGPIHGVGRASVAAPAPMFCVHVARVVVDGETGSFRVPRYAAIHDIGHALYPPGVVAQIHGGILQGLGRAFGEEIVYDAAGQLRTGGFADYLLPTIDLSPAIEIELVEIPSAFGALGARGIGEPPAVPGLAAIANAIRDATGVRLTQAPFSPEAILDARDQYRGRVGSEAVRAMNT
jgi:CO/xanthine dehydrogenase Mo-binding subunit